MDLSDHLGTYVQFYADTNFILDKAGRESGAPLNEFVNFRLFNATNMEKFEELVGNESWEPVFNSISADEKYNKFTNIYNTHYDKAFVLKTTRRKNERKNPKPWILPWLEDACERKNDAYHKKIMSPTPENCAKYAN